MKYKFKIIYQNYKKKKIKLGGSNIPGDQELAEQLQREYDEEEEQRRIQEDENYAQQLQQDQIYAQKLQQKFDSESNQPDLAEQLQELNLEPNQSSTDNPNTNQSSTDDPNTSSSNTNQSSIDYDLIRTNVDGGAHIIPTVQNIVLHYPSQFEGLSPQGVKIAYKVMNPNVGTQSDRFCPLIWRALRKCGKHVPDDLYEGYPNDHDFVDGHTKELSEIPGWCDYAYEVLTHKFDIPKNSNNFQNKYVIDKSIEFHNRIKNKYI